LFFINKSAGTFILIGGASAFIYIEQSMEGWIKIHRKIEARERYTDANTFRVFFHLLINANHKG